MTQAHPNLYQAIIDAAHGMERTVDEKLIEGASVGDNMQDWGFDPYLNQNVGAGNTWTGTAATTTLWNGPICHVCGIGYLGICTIDHRPYIDTGYVGRRRAT